MSNDKVQSIMALKPCPFCGNETPEFERMGTPRQSCIVICGHCGARHESSDEGEFNGTSWNERAAIRAIAAPGVAQGWQPIESAPKDGTEVILLEGARVGAAFWVSWSSSHTEEAGSGWSICWDGDDWHKPTHYMPLPAAPSPTTEQPIKGGPAE